MLEYEASRRRAPGHVQRPRWAMRRWQNALHTTWISFSGRERFTVVRALQDYEDVVGDPEQARDAYLVRLRCLRWSRS
jgi:hypothetical protein